MYRETEWDRCSTGWIPDILIHSLTIPCIPDGAKEVCSIWSVEYILTFSCVCDFSLNQCANKWADDWMNKWKCIAERVCHFRAGWLPIRLSKPLNTHTKNTKALSLLKTNSVYLSINHFIHQLISS